DARFWVVVGSGQLHSASSASIPYVELAPERTRKIPLFLAIVPAPDMFPHIANAHGGSWLSPKPPGLDVPWLRGNEQAESFRPRARQRLSRTTSFVGARRPSSWHLLDLPAP